MTTHFIFIHIFKPSLSILITYTSITYNYYTYQILINDKSTDAPIIFVSLSPLLFIVNIDKVTQNNLVSHAKKTFISYLTNSTFRVQVLYLSAFKLIGEFKRIHISQLKSCYKFQ